MQRSNICVKNHKQTQKNVKKKIRKIDFPKYVKCLSKCDPKPILQMHDPNSAYSLLSRHLNDAIENCSFDKIVNNDEKPWFDKELIKLRREKESAYKTFKNCRTAYNETLSKQIKKKYEALIKLKRKSYFKSLFLKHKGNSKETWKIINRLLGKKRSKIADKEISINGRLCNDNVTIANAFNDFFTELPKKLHRKLPNTPKTFKAFLSKRNMNSFFLNPTSLSEVWKIIVSMQRKSSTGFDKVSSLMLKELPENILICLVHIFNMSFAKGEFIEEFKIAKIIPIPKKGDLSLMKNYRPISLLSCISKVLEKLMSSRLNSFLSKYNLLYRCQFGFRKKYSTELATSFLINKITDAIEAKCKVMGIFIDLSKAFDCLDHSILLHKLDNIGVRGIPLKWFESYLSDRKQKVVYNGFISDSTCNIYVGAPQGSILAPLLYLIYVNDLYMCLSRSEAILFADDTNILITATCIGSLFEIANKELEYINEWLICNKLTVNDDKSNYIIFHNNHNETELSNLCINLGNVKIKRVKSTKFLGIKIDEKLNWNLHMEHILSKTRRNLGVVRKISPFITKDAQYQLYFALIVSHLKYGIIVWHNGNLTMRKKLQACSNNFVRLINSLPDRQSVREIMKDSNLLSINQMYHSEISKLYHKLENGTIPDCFTQLFENQIRASNIRTRSSSTHFQPFRRIRLTQQAFNFQGPKIWNSIPSMFKMNDENCPVENALFSKNIKEYVINNIDFI